MAKEGWLVASKEKKLHRKGTSKGRRIGTRSRWKLVEPSRWDMSSRIQGVSNSHIIEFSFWYWNIKKYKFYFWKYSEKLNISLFWLFIIYCFYDYSAIRRVNINVFRINFHKIFNYWLRFTKLNRHRNNNKKYFYIILDWWDIHPI